MDGRMDQTDDRLDRIENKLDKLSDVQVQIQVDVAEHIRRTAIAEDSITKLSEALQPVTHHVVVVKAILNILAWSLGILGAVATIYAALK